MANRKKTFKIEGSNTFMVIVKYIFVSILLLLLFADIVAIFLAVTDPLSLNTEFMLERLFEISAIGIIILLIVSKGIIFPQTKFELDRNGILIKQKRTERHLSWSDIQILKLKLKAVKIYSRFGVINTNEYHVQVNLTLHNSKPENIVVNYVNAYTVDNMIKFINKELRFKELREPDDSDEPSSDFQLYQWKVVTKQRRVIKYKF